MCSLSPELLGKIMDEESIFEAYTISLAVATDVTDVGSLASGLQASTSQFFLSAAHL